MKCWICKDEIEDGENVLEFEYRRGYLMDGSIETHQRSSDFVIHEESDCIDKMLHLIEQWWDPRK